MSLVYIGFVKVKMLPFDNKSEFQVIVDMPEGTTLEETARVAEALAEEVLKQPEVVNVQTYAGTAPVQLQRPGAALLPARAAPNVADIQVNLLPKARPRAAEPRDREGSARRACSPSLTRFGARIKVAEVPPGPPVLQTLVAEVYGPDAGGPAAHRTPDQGYLRSGPRASWTSTGTSKTTSRSSASSSTKRRLRCTASREDDIARRCGLRRAGDAAGLLHVDAREGRHADPCCGWTAPSRSDLDRMQNLKVHGPHRAARAAPRARATERSSTTRASITRT